MHKIYIISHNTLESAKMLRQDFNSIGIEAIIVENSGIPVKSNGCISAVNKGYLTTWLESISISDLNTFEYFTLCNSDIRLRSKHYFEIDKDANIGVLGPKIIQNGKDIGVFRLSKKKIIRIYADRLRFSNFYIFRLINILRDRLVSLYSAKETPQKSSASLYCDAVHGSIMCVHKSIVEILLDMNKKGVRFPFLYGEEDILSTLSQRLGKKVYYDVSVEIEHIGSESIRRMDSEKVYNHLKLAHKFLNNEGFSI